MHVIRTTTGCCRRCFHCLAVLRLALGQWLDDNASQLESRQPCSNTAHISCGPETCSSNLAHTLMNTCLRENTCKHRTNTWLGLRRIQKRMGAVSEGQGVRPNAQRMPKKEGKKKRTQEKGCNSRQKRREYTSSEEKTTTGG